MEEKAKEEEAEREKRQREEQEQACYSLKIQVNEVNLQERRARLLSSMPSAADSDKNAHAIRLRLPDGRCINHRFSAEHMLQLV